jgi:hypothetical protein
LGKHPVEIGHDEIEVRFAPMSRRLSVDPDVQPAVYFPAYPGNSAPAVWPQNSPGSAVDVREILGDDTFGDAADNRRVNPASRAWSYQLR